MKQALGFLLIFVLLSAGGPTLSEGSDNRYELRKDELRVINRYTPYLDANLQKNEVLMLNEELATHHEAVSALVAAILYKHQPEKYQEVIFDRYAVRDYSLREQGIYNIVDRNEVLSSVGKIETQYPTLKDKRILLLLTFLYYRNSNEWFYFKDQKISAARFFRTAFLASAFKQTEIDPVELANAIDRAAQRKK
jgi:hypothetical protein